MQWLRVPESTIILLQLNSPTLSNERESIVAAAAPYAVGFVVVTTADTALVRFSTFAYIGRINEQSVSNEAKHTKHQIPCRDFIFFIFSFRVPQLCHVRYIACVGRDCDNTPTNFEFNWSVRIQIEFNIIYIYISVRVECLCSQMKSCFFSYRRRLWRRRRYLRANNVDVFVSWVRTHNRSQPFSIRNPCKWERIYRNKSNLLPVNRALISHAVCMMAPIFTAPPTHMCICEGARRRKKILFW